ncbi:MAG: response regulator [Anaerolineae bacterium]|nr:response regulator [Anaerolineae bacterium]
MAQDNIRVLIVEDNYLVSEMIKGLIEEIGYVVAGEATNGFDAVRMTQARRPDVILMDLDMPDMDGIEASRFIRDWCPTPVVILTAYETDDLIRRATEVGVANYLVKPSNQRELRRAITFAIDRFKEMRAWRLQAEDVDAQVEAILQSANDAIFLVGDRGQILRANPVAEAWLSEKLSAEEAACLRDEVARLTERASDEPAAALSFAALDVELRAAPVRTVENAVAVVAARNVTDARRAWEWMYDLLSAVSHELGTPITTIKLYTELMAQRPEKWRDYLPSLTQEANEQVRLLESILHITRVERQLLNGEARPLPLAPLVERVVRGCSPMAEAHGLTLAYRPAALDATILADEQQLAFVVEQLLCNAIHYTPAGGTVTVTTGCEDRKGCPLAWVAVADTGMGILAEELPRIFERFYRGESAKRAQVPGMGLGLDVVKKIVDHHGGHVKVESQAGGGSTFAVYLPVAEALQQ